jgi:putative ABC transport system permease protein
MFPRLLLASLSARRGRATLAFLAVTVGVAVATALATLALQVGDDLARALRNTGPHFVVLPAGASWPLELGGTSFQPARAGAALDSGAVAALKRSFWTNNVLDATPEAAVAATLQGHAVTLLGTWFARDVPLAAGTWHTGLAGLRPRWRVDGRWPREDAAEIALGASLASRTGLHPGQWADLSCGGRSERWLVSGVVAAGGLEDGLAWAPLSRVQQLGDRRDEVDRVWLSALVLPQPGGPAPDPKRDPQGYEKFMCTAYPGNVAASLHEQLNGAEVLPMSEVVAGEAQVVARLSLLMLLLALAALAAATLGLLSTTMASVVERSVELGLLRALGAGSGQIAALLLGESLLVALAGGFAGFALGSLAATLFRGGSFGGHAPVQPLLLPVALVLAVLVAVAGTLAPLRLAQRVDPATVLHG